MKIKKMFKKGLIFSVIGMSLLLYSTIALAATTAYPTYTVIKGDTLWIMSKKFYTTTEQITSANTLKSDALNIGQKLLIPQTKPYTVVQGDTFYLIAKRFNIPLQDFLSANNMTSSATIYPGQRLNLPGYLAYQVMSGDSLTSLAQQFGTTTDQLIKINQLTSNSVNPGQKLYIPYTTGTVNPPQTGTTTTQTVQWDIPPGAVLYHVQDGDNLWAIAKKYNSTMDAIYKTNYLNTDLVMPGEPLIIPQNSTQPIYGIKAPSVPAKPGFGELLDWEYAGWFFNTGSTAVLEDLQTKQQFRIYRIGGGNHADCEPLTSQDTAIMKSIFGNQWTWNTRPVLVHYQGRILAASMAGMPHEWDTIPNNDFYGMFCLHFLNSRTHNTGTIDPNHQASVQKAAGN